MARVKGMNSSSPSPYLLDIEVVEPRDRLPAVEHADHAVIVVVEIQGPADAIRAAEHPVVQLAGDHHHLGAIRVVGGAPRAAV